MPRPSNPKIAPAEIHFIWIGSALPKKYFYLMHSLAALAKKSNFKINLWVDRESNYEKTAGLQMVRIPNLQIRTMTEISEKMRQSPFFQEKVQHIESEKPVARYQILETYLLQESVGAKNYAAYSDIARLIILYLYGGYYFDTDTYFHIKADSLLKQDELEQGLMIGPANDRAYNNNMIAALKEHKILARMIDEVIFYYKKTLNNSESFAEKRLGKSRKYHTIAATGPDMVGRVLTQSEREKVFTCDRNDNDRATFASLSMTALCDSTWVASDDNQSAITLMYKNADTLDAKAREFIVSQYSEYLKLRRSENFPALAANQITLKTTKIFDSMLLTYEGFFKREIKKITKSDTDPSSQVIQCYLSYQKYNLNEPLIMRAILTLRDVYTSCWSSSYYTHSSSFAGVYEFEFTLRSAIVKEFPLQKSKLYFEEPPFSAQQKIEEVTSEGPRFFAQQKMDEMLRQVGFETLQQDIKKLVVEDFLKSCRDLSIRKAKRRVDHLSEDSIKNEFKASLARCNIRVNEESIDKYFSDKQFFIESTRPFFQNKNKFTQFLMIQIMFAANQKTISHLQTFAKFLKDLVVYPAFSSGFFKEDFSKIVEQLNIQVSKRITQFTGREEMKIIKTV